MMRTLIVLTLALQAWPAFANPYFCMGLWTRAAMKTQIEPARGTPEGEIRALPEPILSRIRSRQRISVRTFARLEAATKFYTQEAPLNPQLNQHTISPALAEKLAKFQLLIEDSSTLTPAAIADQTLQWITSYADAVYVYQNLGSFTSDAANRIFAALTMRTDYFKDTYRVFDAPHSLQEFSYEKEVPFANNAVSMMWRVGGFADTVWFQLSDADRFKLLSEAVDNDGFIAPTSLGSYSFGPLTKEVLGGLWEFKHPTYDVSLARLRETVLNASRAVNETHSFHIHQVLSLPNDKTVTDRFLLWYKVMSDQAVFQGWETGMATNKFTGAAVPPAQWFAAADYSYFSGKLTTVALRRGLYGDAPLQGWTKYGLEYRDMTRDLPALFDTIEYNAKQIANSVWTLPQFPTLAVANAKNLFMLDSRRSPDGTPTLYTRKTGVTLLTAAGVPKELAKILTKWSANEESALPLIDFSTFQFFNRYTLTMRAPTPAELDRIRAASQVYVQSLRRLSREWLAAQEAGKPFDPGDVTAALAMDIAIWARAARISELYGAPQ